MRSVDDVLELGILDRKRAEYLLVAQRLYTRIAQYLGAGCLTAQPATGVFESLYGEGSLLLYSDGEDLAAQAEALLAGDAWRERARAGQAKALAVSDTRFVARYVLDRACGVQTFDWPAWTAEFYVKRSSG